MHCQHQVLRFLHSLPRLKDQAELQFRESIFPLPAQTAFRSFQDFSAHFQVALSDKESDKILCGLNILFYGLFLHRKSRLPHKTNAALLLKKQSRHQAKEKKKKKRCHLRCQNPNLSRIFFQMRKLQPKQLEEPCSTSFYTHALPARAKFLIFLCQHEIPKLFQQPCPP